MKKLMIEATERLAWLLKLRDFNQEEYWQRIEFYHGYCKYWVNDEPGEKWPGNKDSVGLPKASKSKELRATPPKSELNRS
ncbi:MAG: hypothetical protein L0Z55_04770 [Planctomycetes bacterium]|nr:hypothetical protein [Planctomycetota bacterium]